MATQVNSRNTLLSTATARTVTNQKFVAVAAPVLTFLYTSAGVLSGTPVITITATKTNTTAPVVWTTNAGVSLYSASTGGVVVTTDSSTASTSVVYLRGVDFATLNLDSVQVTATITDVDILTSSLTITKLQPGATGATGDTAVFAYRVISGASLPTAPSITQSTVPTAGAAVTGTTWYLQPKATLAADEWMFQVSGTRTSGGAYTWQTQSYLSTFKVGKLEALTTDTGNLTISATGSIKTAASVYGQAGAFFIGNDGGTAKFSVGDKLLYSGTTFSLPGITVGTNGGINGIGTGNGTIVNNDVARPGGVNLVGNSGFLRNNTLLPTNWAIYNNANISVTNSVQTGGMFGQNYVRVTANAATTSTLGIYVMQATSDSVKSWEPGQTYCISFWARGAAGALGKIMQALNSNMGFTSSTVLENPVLTGSWQRYVWRVVPANNANTPYGELYISHNEPSIVSGSVFDICCPKVELGTQPSSWTPSPQDTLNIVLEPSITSAQTTANAQSTTTFVGRNVTVNGKTLTKTGGTNNSWDADVYSTDSYTGGAYASVKIATIAHVMFGLNTDPSTDSSFYTIDYALYISDTGGLFDYRNGVEQSNLGQQCVIGDILTVTYDGVNIRYLKNGIVIYTSGTVNITNPLFFDSSFYTTGGSLSNVQFGPLTSIGTVNTTANNAQTTANSKLSKSAADILTGPINLNAANAITVGTPELDSNPVTQTGKNGFYIGSTGIVATKNGTATIVISNNGDATFAGALTGAVVKAGNIEVGAVTTLSASSTVFAPINGTTNYRSGSVTPIIFTKTNGDVIVTCGFTLYISPTTTTDGVYDIRLDLTSSIAQIGSYWNIIRKITGTPVSVKGTISAILNRNSYAAGTYTLTLAAQIQSLSTAGAVVNIINDCQLATQTSVLESKV